MAANLSLSGNLQLTQSKRECAALRAICQDAAVGQCFGNGCGRRAPCRVQLGGSAERGRAGRVVVGGGAHIVALEPRHLDVAVRIVAHRPAGRPPAQFSAGVHGAACDPNFLAPDARRCRGDAGMRAALFQSARTQGSACFGLGYTEDPPPYRDTLTPSPRAGIQRSPIGDTPRFFDPSFRQKIACQNGRHLESASWRLARGAPSPRIAAAGGSCSHLAAL